MIADHLPILQVIIPLCAACLTAVIRSGRSAWGIVFLVSWAMPVISYLLLLQVLADGPFSYHLGGWAPPIGIEYRIDALTTYMCMLVSLVGAVVLPYARLSVASEVSEKNQPWFYSMYLLCLTGSFGIIVTGDAFNAFVFLEIASISSYAMIAMGRDSRALVAAYQYLVIGTIGASFYVIAVGLLYIMTGTLNLTDLSERLADVDSVRPVLAAFAFLMVGLGIKFALFPLHTWLPNAYAYAPCTATAFLSGTSTKIFGYLLMRFIFNVFGVDFIFGIQEISIAFMLLAIASIIVASISAMCQDNVKRMLAYSSIAQIGYVVLGISLASQTSLIASIVHLFNHAISKVCLFMVIGAVTYRVCDAHMNMFVGLGKRMPLTMAAFAVASASLIGIPGTAGFISKWYLAQAALEQGMWWMIVLIVFSSMASILYLGRILELAYFNNSDLSSSSVQVKDVPLSMLIPIWVMALASIYFGFDTRFSVGIAVMAAEELLLGIS